MSAPVTVSGRLTKDPEIRFSNSGTAIASFSIAANERKKNASTGQWEDAGVTFFDCSAFGQTAESIGEKLGKGDPVLATGSIRQREYTTSAGEKRRVFEVRVDDIGRSLKWLDKPRETSRDGDQNPPF